MKKLRSLLRSLFALIGAILLAWHLDAIGWPWWAWLPATILGAMAVYTVCILAWFAWRKATYRAVAREMKRRNRADAED
jgi:membrane protein YdbS with pleckstrin-like domain